MCIILLISFSYTKNLLLLKLMKKSIILDVLRTNCQKTKTPIWLMRQAGRYLPEYKLIRQKVPRFLDVCYDSKLAAEITIQPIRRFGFDAAILFADILVVPDCFGMNVEFKSGYGPTMDTIRSRNDFHKLNLKEEKFKSVWNTISILKEKLPKETSLIGFAGAPWTVATYMMEGCGGSKTNFSLSKQILKEDPDMLEDLINIIIDSTVKYIEGQIKAGAEIIQLFDSWAGELKGEAYKRFIEKPNKILVEKIRKIDPKVPIICFPKGIEDLESFIDNVKPDCLGISSEVDLDVAKKLKEKVIIQGNLDPEILASTKEKIKSATENILNKLGGNNFIFNLGHGILPHTPIENVEFLVDLVRKHEKNSHNIA